MRHYRLTLVPAIAFAALLCSPSPALCQTLGAAQNFGIVGGSAVTAAVGAVPSQIAGDVGVSPGTSITGFPPALGAVVIPPFILHSPNDGPSIAAQAAVTALFVSLSTAGGPATPIPDQLAGQNLGPGVYSLGAANLSSGGLLTLTGNGTYIFRVASSLVTISTSNIRLIGAQACNIWWQVGSSATLGGATFAGNVVGLTGTNSMGPNARLEGRLLTTTPGAVTLAGNNTVVAAFCAAVAPPPGGPVGLTKAFSPSTNGLGGISTLTLTLTNANASAATMINALIDPLPPGVTVAPSPNASTTCGSGLTATPGGSSVTLSPGGIIPGGSPGSCTVIVNVTSTIAGIYTNTIPVNALLTNNGFNAVPAISILNMVAGIPAVPTLSEWAIIVLAALLCLCGFFALRRRRMTD